jgi:hypothetical protein
MSRSRAPIEGGYTRKTLSLPTDLVDKIEEKLKETPGLTMSSFMTEAAEKLLFPMRKLRRKK